MLRTPGLSSHPGLRGRVSLTVRLHQGDTAQAGESWCCRLVPLSELLSSSSSEEVLLPTLCALRASCKSFTTEGQPVSSPPCPVPTEP